MLLHADSRDVTLYLCSSHEHKHIDTDRKFALPKKSKEKLTELLELGVRRNNDLNKALKKAGLPQLKFTQLNNFKSRFTASTIGKPSATLGELETWCTNNKSIPEDMDTVFCGDFSYELKNNKVSGLRIFVTTKRLIEATIKGTNYYFINLPIN